MDGLIEKGCVKDYKGKDGLSAVQREFAILENTYFGQVYLFVPINFIRAGIEYFRIKGELEYSYFTTSRAKGEVYATDFRPSSD